MDPYTNNYSRQARTGFGSSYYNRQSGRGLGSFVGSIFRNIYPYIKSGFSVLRDKLVSGGVGLFNDTVNQFQSTKALLNVYNSLALQIVENVNECISLKQNAVEERVTRGHEKQYKK
ncbi:hypothetical protein B566_EDAN013226 [Ephemera danica]|nr:hypothetical protein B566_EDAN013226 [Ephemera danica]